MKKWIRLAAWVISTIGVHACGGTASDSTPGNTNWLKRCYEQADCGSGLSYVCNSCEEPCTENTDCDLAGPGSRCAVRPAEAECDDEASAEGRFCIKGCDVNADCERDDLTCAEGACVLRDAIDGGISDSEASAHAISPNGDGSVRSDSSVPNMMAMVPEGGIGVSTEAGICEEDSGGPNCLPVGAPAGGAITELATGQQGAYKLALDDTHVYWTTHGLQTVMKVSKLGGGVETIATLADNPYDIVADDDGVFWTRIGGVMTMNRATGDYATVVSGGGFSWSSLAMDQTRSSQSWPTAKRCPAKSWWTIRTSTGPIRTLELS